MRQFSLNHGRFWLCSVLVCSVAAACANSESEIGKTSRSIQELDVQLRDVLILGADDSASPEYLFGAPRFVVTDSQGHIYVADEAVMNIRSYDAAGHYLRTIGQRGQGPGEFQSFTGMTINRQDEIITLDRGNARFTRFSPEGKELDTHPSRMWAVSRIHPFRGGYLILNNHAEGEGVTDYLFRGFNPNFQETTVVFGSADEIIDPDEMLEQTSLSADPGSFIFMDSGVLFAPSLYEGKLYLYTEEQGQWKQARQFLGHVGIRRSYKKILDGPMDTEHVDALLRYAGKDVGALVHNSSKGLFRLQDQHIVHFTFCEFGQERLFGVEVFEEDGSLIGYGVIDRVPLTAHGTASLKLRVVWKDDQDRFYIIDQEEKPVIRVVELEFGPISNTSEKAQR